jgi:hypothetical protein
VLVLGSSAAGSGSGMKMLARDKKRKNKPEISFFMGGSQR